MNDLIDVEAVDPFVLPCVDLCDRDKLPACPAVYFVASGDRTILYIGQTQKLVKRWTIHHKLEQVQEFHGVKIFWLEVEDLSVLLSVEKLLIDAFKPPLNCDRKTLKRYRKPRDPILVSNKPVTPVGWNLRQLMGRHRLTNEQLAGLLGEKTGSPRSPATISNWRNSDEMPLIDGVTLACLAEILEVDINELLNR